jgi:hypothetical protein
MARQPFVWEVHVPREMVEDELERLRQIPYSVWRDAIGLPRTKDITGRDDRIYTLTVLADWASGSQDDIRVTLSLSGPGRRRGAVRQTFVISPPRTFNAER